MLGTNIRVTPRNIAISGEVQRSSPSDRVKMKCYPYCAGASCEKTYITHPVAQRDDVANGMQRFWMNNKNPERIKTCTAICSIIGRIVNKFYGKSCFDSGRVQEIISRCLRRQ